eukprot:gene31699-41145_t
MPGRLGMNKCTISGLELQQKQNQKFEEEEKNRGDKKELGMHELVLLDRLYGLEEE